MKQASLSIGHSEFGCEMKYPPPEANTLCPCNRSMIRCFWCKHGHPLECHYPYTCREAACSHLALYRLSPEELAALERKAREAIASGGRAPFYFDSEGIIRIHAEQPTAEPPRTK